MNENEVVIEKQKIIRMVNRIYELERENTKTGKRNEKEMKTAIERIIEEEAKKCY
jgi:tRNA(Ser,Leu) C12 N-acetylase TAN1